MTSGKDVILLLRHIHTSLAEIVYEGTEIEYDKICTASSHIQSHEQL